MATTRSSPNVVSEAPTNLAPTRLNRSSLVAMILGSIVFLSPLLHYHTLKANRATDFKALYSSAACMVSHCNPYDASEIKRQFALRGGDISRHDDAFDRYFVGYPPSSTFWVTPFALLPWDIALPIWLAVCAVLFLVAAYLVADLCTPQSTLAMALLAVFLATSDLMIRSAQPAGPAIALSCIAVWCLLKRRYAGLAIVCFALGLVIKPQMGGLLLVFFFLSGGTARLRSLQIAATTVLFCLPGIVWASLMPESSHWVRDLGANLAGISATGNLSDSGPKNGSSYLFTNLQSVLSIFRDDRHLYNLITWSIVGAMLLIWAYVALRARPSLQKDLLGIATISCLTLMPIYHRHYDARILLLTFPAVALLLARGGKTKWAALCVAITTILGSHPDIMRRVVYPLRPLNRIETALFMRTLPILLLVYSIFYLAYFLKTLKPGELASTPSLGDSAAAIDYRLQSSGSAG